jgi:F-box protein 11
MSYARFNDQHDDGQLTQFRERLSAEIQVQTGEEFPIFQDRSDIAWGQAWQQRIDQTLDAVTLLVVIITPSLFRSRACREEVERFRARERELGREDLILPVYYVSAQELDDSDVRGRDELAKLLASRQFADWRELRFEPFTSPTVRKALARLAARMRDMFWRPPPDALLPHVEQSVEAVPKTGIGRASRELEITGKTEPPTHVVDPYQRGGFATISEAIEAAQPGDRILVRPGLYDEGLVIDKPLEILGDGPVADITVRANSTEVIVFSANIGRVANLTLIQEASYEYSLFGIDIRQGRLELEGCDITSRSSSCVNIRGGADPRVRSNRIHSGVAEGVLVYEALGILEDNEITGNDTGVAIMEGSNPTLRRNLIQDNKRDGFYVYENGLGILEDNEITANGSSGVLIAGGGNPILRRNQVRSNKEAGISVYYGGLGVLESNDITGNGSSGLTIEMGGNPTVRDNRISLHPYVAVNICDGGGGIFEDNDMRGNVRGAWIIAAGSEVNLTRARNKETDEPDTSTAQG